MRFLALILLVTACGGVDDETLAEDATSRAFSVSPASATSSPATVTLADSTKKGHGFAVSCTGGGVASPASGKVTSAKKAVVTVTAPGATTCTFASTSGSKASATFTIAPATPHVLKTVFVVMMENHNWSQIKGSASAPYINSLLATGAHAEQYFNPPGMHPSEPNYLWLEAGTNFGVKNDGLPSANHQSSTQHLVNQLEAAGLSWKAYAEGISGASCPTANAGKYAPKHVPFVFFDDVASSSRCTAHVRPYAELAGDLASGNVAAYNFITPDLCDDMHDSTGCATSNSVKNGDGWLSTALPPILASAAYTSGGAVFVTFDESEGGDVPIMMLALSPFAKPAYSSSARYTHSSLLRTVQEIFGLSPFLGDAANATDLSDFFTSFP